MKQMLLITACRPTIASFVDHKRNALIGDRVF